MKKNEHPIKLNYQVQLDKILKQISSCTSSSAKEKLLLHACCAPCSSYVLEYLSNFFDITIFYYNPNIHPKKEYVRRLSELKSFLPNFIQQKNIPQFNLIEAPYIPEDFFSAVNTQIETNLQTEPEKGERCRRCYFFRMKKAYNFAVEHNFDWFTTTLSISPFKDADKINIIGKELENTHSSGPKFLTSDFKKKGGFKRSLELSSEFGLYRQDYCGCIFSKQNMKNFINQTDKKSMHDILSDSTDANFIGFRQMTKDDILNVLSLMEPFINRGILLPRTENSLLEKLNDYVVYQIDGGIHACAALHIYNSIEGEIAAVAVDESYSKGGIGVKLINYLLEKAKEQNLKSVFVLSTQTVEWFEKLGFKKDLVSSLPPERKKIWSPERNSKVLRISL